MSVWGSVAGEFYELSVMAIRKMEMKHREHEERRAWQSIELFSVHSKH